MSITVAIADDQPGMRLALRKIIEKAPEVKIVGEAENGEELVALVEKTNPRVIFLDVEMPIMNGLDSAKRIQDINPKTILVFATAHDEYMSNAFELYAFDYMVKPFKMERVLQTLERITEIGSAPALGDAAKLPLPSALIAPEARKPVSRLMIKHKDGVTFVDTEDIRLIQRENRTTVLVTVNGEHATSESLGELEGRLNPNNFFRCHKSYIINIDYIDNITPYGRWTHIVRLKGTQKDALITHEKFEELQRMFL